MVHLYPCVLELCRLRPHPNLNILRWVQFSMPLTDTVTFADLIQQYRDELDNLEDSYSEMRGFAEDEYGEKKLQWSEELQQMSLLFEQTHTSIEQRINALEKLRDEFGESEFEIKMLSGQETMDVETELKLMAHDKGVEVDVVNHERNRIVVDKAVVDAPEGVPRDDDDSPIPSEAPNPLMMSLYEAIQNVNQSGNADFRASGFEDGDDLALPESFDQPSN